MAKKLWEVTPFKQLKMSFGVQRFMLVLGLAIVTFFVLVAAVADLIAPYHFSQLQYEDGTYFGSQQPPSAQHIWGTTVGGFDVFSRVVYGTQTAIAVIVIAVVLSIVVGVLLGLVSGYISGWLDKVLVLVADAVYAFPSLLLAIALSIVISGGRSGFWSGILAAGLSITVIFIPQYYRAMRAETLRIKQEAFVESAQVLGASSSRILFRHIFRNATRTLPIIFTLNASEAILTLAGLGFFGFGIDPTMGAEWGYDLNRAVADVSAGIWWTSVFPGSAIVLVVLGITLVGESLNDLADPRLRRRQEAEIE